MRRPRAGESFFFRVKTGRRTSYVELESETPGERAVWVAQMRLRALGLYSEPLPVDGKPTPQTREAVRRFQRLAGLRVTGDVHDAATRIALRDAARVARVRGIATP